MAKKHKFKVGDIVFVLPYTEVPVMCRRRVCGNRWGRIINTNADSPRRKQEGALYFVESLTGNLVGGWENKIDLELIVAAP